MHSTVLVTFTRRLAPWILAAALAVTGLLLGGMPTAHASSYVGPKKYYIATGNSISFGYQPNLNWDDGYSTDWANQMRTRDPGLDYDNLACPGETTTTFLNGGCPYWYMRKYFYTGSQMSAVLYYLTIHAGQVSPVSLDIGATDLLACDTNGSINTLCAANALHTVATNLPIIVSRIKAKLNGTGDFFLMNYYDPFQNAQPSTLYWVDQLNAETALVGKQYGVPVVDVAGIYRTDQYPTGGNPAICAWSWMCSFYRDIHPNDAGYAAIAQGFEKAARY